MPLTDEEIKNLLTRNDDLKTVRSVYEPIWEEIAKFVLPRRVGPAFGRTPGAKKTEELFDSTAIHANALLGATLHGTLTPSSSRWAHPKLRGRQGINNIKDVADWLEECADQMQLAFHQSNFNSEIHEIDLDLPSFGAGCLFVEEKPIETIGFNGLRFQAIPNMQYCTAENAEGVVDTIFREFELSARAAEGKWGEDNLGEKVKGKLKEKPDEKFTFLHTVFPNENGGAKPFVSHYIGIGDKNEISTGGYYEFPYLTPRWSKDSGEDYGNGQGQTALPDIRTLNKAKEYGLKGWAKDLDPATFEKDESVIGSLDLRPGGRNIARDKDSIWTLDRKARYDVSQIKEDALRQSIREMFFSDQLSLPEKSDMREMEIAVRYELMHRVLGPTLGRFETELLNPLIERVFGLMMRASSGKFRVLPPPPPILADLGIREIDIEYEGPLAKAQRAGELMGMRKFFDFGAAIASAKPEVLDIIDGDEAVRYGAEVTGVPSKILNSEEEVATIREERARVMAEEKQKEDLERLAAGVKDITPAVKAMAEGGKE